MFSGQYHVNSEDDPCKGCGSKIGGCYCTQNILEQAYQGSLINVVVDAGHVGDFTEGRSMSCINLLLTPGKGWTLHKVQPYRHNSGPTSTTSPGDNQKHVVTYFMFTLINQATKGMVQ